MVMEIQTMFSLIVSIQDNKLNDFNCDIAVSKCVHDIIKMCETLHQYNGCEICLNFSQYNIISVAITLHLDASRSTDSKLP
jgi:hypothetical protein